MQTAAPFVEQEKMTITKDKPKARSSALPPNFQWQCVAWCQGRLKRSKPDDKGNRKLFFQCTDGTLLNVLTVGRDKNDSLLWILTHVEDCFNANNVWQLYPQAVGGTNYVTPSAIIRGRDRTADSLQFSASVGNIDLEKRPGILPLFIGRNMGRGFHFCNLTIPQKFDLPDLSKGDLIKGEAVRSGDQWTIKDLHRAG